MVYWKNNPGCQSIDNIKQVTKEADHIRQFWKKPRISILMPTYNRTKYLREAIESVMRQTFVNWELLVIDDGSDPSYRSKKENLLDTEPYNEVKEIVDSFKDSRIKYLRKENGGLSDALNYGLDRSQGDYIAMLDDDDIWFGFHLKMLYDWIKKQRKEDNVGVIYGQTMVGEIKDGKIIVYSESICAPFVKRYELSQRNKLTTCSVLFEKSIIYKHGLYFDETLKTHMDWDMWLRLSKHTNFLYVDIQSSVYRIHDKNMLAQGNNKIAGTTTIQAKEDTGAVRLLHIKF